MRDTVEGGGGCPLLLQGGGRDGAIFPVFIRIIHPGSITGFLKCPPMYYLGVSSLSALIPLK